MFFVGFDFLTFVSNVRVRSKARSLSSLRKPQNLLQTTSNIETHPDEENDDDKEKEKRKSMLKAQSVETKLTLASLIDPLSSGNSMILKVFNFQNHIITNCLDFKMLLIQVRASR